MELKRLESYHDRPEFTCGDDDLDDFYLNDSRRDAKELLCVTYALMEDAKAVGFFSLSNDSLRRDVVGRSAFRRLSRPIPHGQRYRAIPAAKIGRLATCVDAQGRGYGTKVIDYLKVWFKDGNKTGCRLLIVDAYNNDKVLNFYERNDFVFLSSKDQTDPTRLMYFDLTRFEPAED